MTPGMKEKYQSVLDNIEELYYEVDRVLSVNLREIEL